MWDATRLDWANEVMIMWVVLTPIFVTVALLAIFAPRIVGGTGAEAAKPGQEAEPPSRGVANMR